MRNPNPQGIADWKRVRVRWCYPFLRFVDGDRVPCLNLADFVRDLCVKVILVHSGDRLVEFLGTKASQKTLKWLRNKKVEVILNDRYVDQ